MSLLKEPLRHISIKDWSEEDKPREKLASQGRKTLSDAELLAILLGSGSRSQSALELSKSILNRVNNHLGDLGRMEIRDLISFPGVGEAKATTIVAALELGRRRNEAAPVEKPVIRSSQDAYQILYPVLTDLAWEEFWILLLNRANAVVDKVFISRGGITGTVADSRIIFRHALDRLASGIVLSHNHPSGNINPSEEDINLTRKIREAAKLFDLNILDHLIITNSSYYSFADQGLL